MTPRFAALFWRQSIRSALHRPWLSCLNVSSIALGVGVFLAIQLANQGALESFRSAVALTSGRADLEIRGDLSDEIFPAVLSTPGVRAATPLVEGLVTIPDVPGEYLHILGVDPLTGRDLFAFQLSSAEGGSFDLERWLGDPEAIAVSSSSNAWLRPLLKNGSLAVLAGISPRMLRPTFVFQPEQALAQTDQRVAAMDLGWAQELLGQSGHFTSIEILLTDPKESQAVAEHLRQLVPGDVTVGRPATRSEDLQSMLAAFQLNLTAMSLVSLIVGMFLIYNSVSAAVVRRWTEIAILRANGATRLEVRLLFLGEAILEALIGSALALILAPVLAGVVAAPLESSISSLYELVRIGSTRLDARQMIEAFALGLGAAFIAAWRPAAEAARCDPARILHPGATMERSSPLRIITLPFAAALLLIAFLASAWTLNGGPKEMGFVSAGAILAGFSLLVPWLAGGVAICLRRGLLLRLASDHLVRALHRNAITMAALAAAVAMSISVSVMIHSFRASVERWINHTLIADLFVSPAANDIGGFQTFLPPGALDWFANQPEVRAISTFREMPIRSNGSDATLTVVQGQARGDLEFLTGSPPDAAARFAAGEAVAISESLASRFHLQSGAQIELSTPRGPQTFSVCGVYRDFSRERGVIMMQSSLFSRFWDDNRWHSLNVALHQPQEGPALAQRFREAFGQQGQFVIYDQTSLKKRVFEIFDKTFAVTGVLRGIAVFVAVIGVLFSLSALVLEREREIGVLRSLGASRPQVLGIFLGEAALMGLTACLSGLVSGAVLALVLTWVINKAFFGWTIDLSYPLSSLAMTPLWLIPAALFAALLPAWRAANIAPARAVRFE